MKNYFFLIITIVAFYSVSAQSVHDGVTLFESEKISEAQLVFEKILKESPSNVKAIEYLGDIYFKQGKWSEAASQFKQLIKTDNYNAVYHYKYAGAIGLHAKNNKLKALFLIDDIKFHFKKAASLDAKFIDARLALVQLYSELPLALGGSRVVAEKYAEQIKPLSAQAYKEALLYLKG